MIHQIICYGQMYMQIFISTENIKGRSPVQELYISVKFPLVLAAPRFLFQSVCVWLSWRGGEASTVRSDRPAWPVAHKCRVQRSVPAVTTESARFESRLVFGLFLVGTRSTAPGLFQIFSCQTFNIKVILIGKVY